MIKRQLLPYLISIITVFGCNREISKNEVSLPCGYSCNPELVGEGAYNEALTQDQITEDINILVTTLKSNHPGIFDYQSEEDFMQLIGALKTQIKSAPTVLDAYKLVSTIIASVSDAHTYVMNPYYQNILQEELLFPIIPTINNNQITITGKRLKSINGYSEAEILKRLQSFLNSDGNTIPYKNAFIEMEFPLKYFVFMDDSAEFELVLENGEPQHLKGKSYFKTGLRPADPGTSFTIEGNNAILKIPSWEDDSASSFNQDLEAMAQNSTLGKFINESLEEAINSKATHLTIDLTGNKGGKSGPAALLLSYLISKPFKYYSEISVSSNSFPTKEYITNKELVAFYESKDAHRLIEEIEGNYFFKDMLLPTISPQPHLFLGPVEILVDKYSLSVSTDVVAILKKNRAVKITGDEIGGSLEHYCAGNYLNLRLPNSGIEVNIPLQRLKY